MLFFVLFLRGVGCIMYEMISGRPLFPGATVEDELHLIFRTLGTPTESTWPGIATNEEFNQYNFNTYQGESLLARAPRLAHDSALGLLSKFLLVGVNLCGYESIKMELLYYSLLKFIVLL